MKKHLKESEIFPLSKYADKFGFLNFSFVFDLEYFLANASEIVKDYHYYGNCVLQDGNKAYGLLFKDKDGDDNDIYMKAYVYRWPQDGILHGGATFWPGSKNFSEELKKAILEIR